MPLCMYCAGTGRLCGLNGPDVPCPQGCRPAAVPCNLCGAADADCGYVTCGPCRRRKAECDRWVAARKRRMRAGRAGAAR